MTSSKIAAGCDNHGVSGHGAIFVAGEAMATKAGALAAKPGNENACTKCGSKTRVIGRSQTPAALYLRCDGCGHVSVVPQAKR